MIFPIGINDMDGIGNLACDSVADVSDLTDYAKSQKLRPGSSCMCIDTGTLYMMKSDYSWKEV